MNEMAGPARNFIGHPYEKLSWAVALALCLTLFATPSCDNGGKSEVSVDEVVEQGRRCLQPVMDAAGSLRPQQEALNDCFTKVMADVRGRNYLLGAGNAAVVSWARGVAAAAGDHLPEGESRGLGPNIKDASELGSVRDGVDNLDVLYRAFLEGLRASVKQSEDAAAELSGVLSFLAVEARQPVSGSEELAAAGERYVRDDLSTQVQAAIDRRKSTDREKFKEGSNFLMEDEIEPHLLDMLAVVLWAEDRIRSKIVSGPVLPGESPGSPPPTTTPEGQAIEPPLSGADGALRIPGADEQPAHKLFFDWLERGGGAQLYGATLVVLSNTELEAKFRNLAQRVYARD